MTKFADQLFDDLMREHGSALNTARPLASSRPIATRRVLLAVGGTGVAVAAAAGVLAATAGVSPSGSAGQVAGGKPAYAVTNNPNGTITLAVYKKDGIAGANAKLHELGDSQVYVVPVGAGCPSLSSLPAPAKPLNGKHLSVQSSVTVGASPGGSVTVNAKGIPAGDILVVAVETTKTGNTTTSVGGGRLTTAPAPGCVSLPSADVDFGFGSGTSGPGVTSGHATGKSTSAQG